MNTNTHFKTQNMAVGYNRQPLIENINLDVRKGEILTLIGPNGSGKSTVLKTITKHLPMIAGAVFIGREDVSRISGKDLAKHISVVLTERVSPELMCCWDVVATGRYPYTNGLGKLREEDNKAVENALRQVNALDLAEREFANLSDGQRQRIMLARAICQEPEIIVLDEPTSYLDIRYKIELLDILQGMVKKKGITVIMSLHEIDLALKVSDRILCIKDGEIMMQGPPAGLSESLLYDLFDIHKGSYNCLFGSVEMVKAMGRPSLFVIGGNGKGAPIYRSLQKMNLPFSTGILHENDLDYAVGRALANNVFVEKAFSPIGGELYRKAAQEVKNCSAVINSGVEIGWLNKENTLLIEEARRHHIPVMQSLDELETYLSQAEKLKNRKAN